MANATLPSALQRFTSEFGMGSGGSTALLPPGKILIQKADVNNDVARGWSLSLNLSSSCGLLQVLEHFLGVVWLSLTGN